MSFNNFLFGRHLGVDISPTLKANYYKMGVANLLQRKYSGLMAQGVLIEYEFQNNEPCGV